MVSLPISGQSLNQTVIGQYLQTVIVNRGEVVATNGISKNVVFPIWFVLSLLPFFQNTYDNVIMCMLLDRGVLVLARGGGSSLPLPALPQDLDKEHYHYPLGRGRILPCFPGGRVLVFSLQYETSC